MRFLDHYTASNTGPSPGRPDVSEVVMRPRASDGFVLCGCVLQPDRVLERGYVEVHPDGTISAVTEKRPGHARLLETDGIVLPGLLDLHNHPEWNVFPAWEPPMLYANRYEWRQSALYHQLVAGPQTRLIEGLPPQTQLRYSEIRAVIGGVTAIQGAASSDAGSTPSLIRTVDQQIFGHHYGRAMVDLPKDETDKNRLAELHQILADIARGAANAFYVHLAEGGRDDAESAGEFDHLVQLNALTAATIVIHGAALNRHQLGAMRDVGAKLVWSPQSNLRLYGQTTRAADALDVGLPMAIGADWLPSGSPSLLAELRVAREVLHGQARPLPPRELVGMVTHQAARIAGLSDELGLLAMGRAADITVLRRLHEDPWESVLLADRADVLAVFLGGSLVYGEQHLSEQLGLLSDDPSRQIVLAWGRPMLLDTGVNTANQPPTPTPNLAQLRTDIIALFPALGPVFA